MRVFEQAAELREVGAGVQLGANGTRILIALGLEAAMRQVVCAATSKEIRLGTTGQSWPTFDLGETSVERFGAPYWMVHRGDFHKVLLDAVRAAKPGRDPRRQWLRRLRADQPIVSPCIWPMAIRPPAMC